MKAHAVDHICFAVKDLKTARTHYEEVLGLELHCEYEMPAEQIHVARYYLGDVALELMEPMSEDSDVGRFLKQKGEGFFLISYRVGDVEKALADMEKAGLKTIDQRPREAFGNRYAFLENPRNMFGVLTEIVDGAFDIPASK